MNTLHRFYLISIIFIASLSTQMACADGFKQVAVNIHESHQNYAPALRLNQRTSSDSGNQTQKSAYCSAYLPTDAIRVNDIELCLSDHDGKKSHYACQTFVSHDKRYRVYFKGGVKPKAIARIQENGAIKEMLWTESEQQASPACDFQPPIQVPAETKFMGAGVCNDKNDRPVPCTVFRHKAPRCKSIKDYMVYYSANGSGPEYTSSIYIGLNRNAAPAELAYQIGLNLLKTRCCKQRGLEYIEHAYLLFPDSSLYRDSYDRHSQILLRAKQQLSSSEYNR